MKTLAINKRVLSALALCFGCEVCIAEDFLFPNNRKKRAAIGSVQAWRIGFHGLRKTMGYHLWNSIEIEVKSNVIVLLGGGALVGIGGVCAILFGKKRKKCDNNTCYIADKESEDSLHEKAYYPPEHIGKVY